VTYLESLGHSVIGCSRKTGCDAGDFERIKSELVRCDLAYHLAADARPAESLLSPWQTVEVNLRTTTNIGLACSKTGVPLVYASSCEIYGDSLVPLLEESSLRPTNPYAASKLACDRLLFSFHRSYGLDVKIPRLFNPYGPHQQLNKIIPTLYRQASEGKPLTVYGDGSDTRDYVFIEDIARGLWEARRLPAGEAVNLATGISTTSKQIADILILKTLSKSVVRFVPYPEIFGGIRNQVGSYEKAKRLLLWEPKTNIDVGLDHTIRWLKSLNET
jgi:nucleoside-diphosphate-sugar epimerase